MSIWSRIVNVFRGDPVSREIEEELQSHVEEAIEQGRDPGEARRAFGSALRHREQSRDVRLVAWLDALRADVVFGWRQIRKRKMTSAAAILSLGLAIGACTAAFRLIDALMLRPLPVAQPKQLYVLAREGAGLDGKPGTNEAWTYPAFQRMREAAKGQAELLAISFAVHRDLTWKSDQEMEKAYVQYVSGRMFASFGLRPAIGRLLTEGDDLKPQQHPYAVLSHDFWIRRFGGDPTVIGRTFHLGSDVFHAGNDVFEVIGVLDEPFSGTEPGTVTDIFVPTMMHSAVSNPNAMWFRTFAKLQPGTAPEPLRARLDAVSRAFEQEQAKGFKGVNKLIMGQFLKQSLVLNPAAAGVSTLQKAYRTPLAALGLLVVLVLLIACANISNLMTAQAAARAREMALRVSIGAGRLRLVQLVVVEGAILAILAAAAGELFARWSAPFVVSRINPADRPVRLFLSTDWRALGFGIALTLGVTLLLGLLPALRASAVQPVSALKGGDDPHSRRRMMRVLVALQAAFCFLVLFAATLFVATFDRLSHRPIGFSPERILALDTVAASDQPPVAWDQVADHLRAVPGVEAAAIATWPLLSGVSARSFISINGAPPGPVLGYYMGISPGWIAAMKVPLIRGRDFREGDTSPGTAIVSEAFAKQFFPGEDPIGRTFARGNGGPDHIVGVVGDVPYESMRGPTLPVAYVPLHGVDAKGVAQPLRQGAFVVRTSAANPLGMATTLRREVARAHPGFRVSNVRTQIELVEAQTIRERLLAALALFFAAVALLLANVGLYGILEYTIAQRRREIGIRIALGAGTGDVARRVTMDVLAMVVLGAATGMALAVPSARYVQTLLYQVKAEDPAMLALPSLAILAAALLAAVPAVIHAMQIEPVEMLRAE